MCGIVGYVGRRDATSVLLHGLEQLVYRGYDSAGVALHGADGLVVRKVAGPVEGLAESIRHENFRSASGIGHTRWATHGAPVAENAHPHVDCEGRLAIVHNGIIDNADVLRAELVGNGHTLRTATDTEVLAHLLEEAEGDTLCERMSRMLPRVQGTYGLAAVSADEPGVVVAARRGSPVLIGLGEEEYFVASDGAAVREYTDRVMYLEDGDLACVTSQGCVITGRAGRRVERATALLEWSPEDVDLGQHDRYMIKEIHEQPHAIRRTLSGRLDLAGATAALETLGLSRLECREIRRVEIVACGTSWHAGLIGRYILEELAGLPVQVEYASEYRYKPHIKRPGSLAVAISQSGETADTLEALRTARELGSRLLGLVNVVGSTIARECDGTVYLHSGPEIGVASTKAFTSQIAALLLLGLYLGRERGHLRPQEAGVLMREMARLPDYLERALELDGAMKDLSELYHDVRGLLYLGRGINFPVALEGALKLKEVSYIYAEGHPAAEMKHGPIALVDEHTPVFFVVPRDALFNKVLANMQEVKARGGKIIAVCAEGENGELKRLSDHMIPVPCAAHHLLTPLTTVVPLQLFAYHVAMRRGCNVDRPRNLAKSVTVE